MASVKNTKTDLLVIVLGFSIIGLLAKNNIVIWCAVGAGVLALMFSWFETGLLWLWNKIAHVMGQVMSKVLLGVVFYVFLFPLSVLKRIFSQTDSLRLKRPEESTVWVTRNHKYIKEDLTELF
jgi:hypothetical protein